MAVKWSILIATHVSRSDRFGRLVGQLASQVTDDVEVVVLWNRGEKTIGEYRQALLEAADGEYVSFVDDDDRLPDYFISDALKAMSTDPDYVGFEVVVKDGSERPINSRYRDYVAYHSLRHDRWYQRENRFYRHVSHLNPLRRALALKATFTGARSEDHGWADQVRPHVQTEAYIDRPMYFYDFDQSGSVRSGLHRDDRKAVRPSLPDGFRYHPDSDT